MATPSRPGAQELRVRIARALACLALTAGLVMATSLFSPARAGEPTAPGRGPAGWIEQINSYRTMCGLDPVVEDWLLSEGDLNHARYLTKRFEVELPDQVDVHSEGRDTPWSTPSGATAAQFSDIAMRATASQSADAAAEVRQIIEDWIADPFERLPILDPDLRRVGLGIYREKQITVVVLQVLTPPSSGPETAPGTEEEYVQGRLRPKQSSKFPVAFPPDRAEISLLAYEGIKWPGPGAECAGYGPLVGLPISFEFGPSVGRETIVGHSVTENGKPLEHCIFTPDTYRGVGEAQTMLGRRTLMTFGAVVVVPRQPLRPGIYTVSINTRAKEYRWSFAVH